MIKDIQKIFCISLLAFWGQAFSAPSIQLQATNIDDESARVTVSYENSNSNAVGVQFNLSIPSDQAAIESIDCKTLNNADINTCNAWGNSLPIGLLSQSLNPIESGELVAFTVRSKQGAFTQSLQVSATNIIYGDKLANEIKGESSESSITIVPTVSSQVNISTLVTANGALSCSPSGLVNVGTLIQCTATPDTYYEVDAWTGICATTVGNSCSFTAQADQSVSASFKISTYNIVTQITGQGNLTCIPMTGNAGEQVTCQVNMSVQNSHFQWGKMCAGQTGMTCQFTAGAGNQIVQAIFGITSSTNLIAIPSLNLLGLSLLVILLIICHRIIRRVGA